MIASAASRSVIRTPLRTFCQAAASLEVPSGLPQIFAKIRDSGEGSRASRKLRKEKVIPGVIYGPDWPNSSANGKRIAIAVNEKDIKREQRVRALALENTLYEIVLDDNTKFKAIIRQYQVCGLTEQPLNVNFLRYRPGTRLRVPVVYINDDSSVDMKRGSYLVHINRFVNCVCNLENEIPRVITVDLSSAKTGDIIKLSGITLPKGLVPLLGKSQDVVLGKIEKP